MKKRLGYCFILTAVMVLVLTGISFSGERATKEEVIAKVGEAAKMIRDKGIMENPVGGEAMEQMETMERMEPKL